MSNIQLAVEQASDLCSDAHPYLTLKIAHELFKKSPPNLEPAERQRVTEVALRQLKIEQRILCTPEAALVVLPHSVVDQAAMEIRDRYPTREDYLADLERCDLDPIVLIESIERNLKIDAVLDRVASLAVEVSDLDVEIFYVVHREQFRRADNRTLRHILVTINDTLAGSERPTARAKIDAIHTRLQKAPKRFAEQALKHSECPTATNGGLLGRIKHGQLYAELEPAAFTLSPGEISPVVESPMGFHILQCVSVEAAGDVPMHAVRDRIRTHLNDSRRRAAQKAWIAGLFKKQRLAAGQ